MSIDGGLRAEFRKHLPQFDWCSIESGTTGGGIPDSNYCARPGPLRGLRDYGVEGWIEYKQTTGHAVTLRPEQVGWIARRVRHGGRVHIAVRRRTSGGPRQGAPVDQLWLIPGQFAAQAKAHGLRGAYATRHWDGGPSRWDWDTVAAALVS